MINGVHNLTVPSELSIATTMSPPIFFVLFHDPCRAMKSALRYSGGNMLPVYRQGLLKVRPLVATIGNFSRRVHPEKGRKKQDAAIAILDIGRMNDGVQQQTQRVYENMALLALDLFAPVIAMRIDAGPPFSALFTLWLSTMAALGLASRSPCSRHAT